MSNDSPSTSSTYQSIVIALVAGLILSAGVLTVVFRRRRRARFVAMVRRAGGNVDDLRWVELADGTVVRMPEDGGLLGGGGRGRKSVGREPGLYDIQVGEGQKGEEVNVIGIVGDEWRPFSTVVTDYTAPPSQRPASSASSATESTPRPPHVSLSILIAMPTPSLNNTTNHSSTSASSSATSFSYQKPIHHDDYSIMHRHMANDDRDDDYLPHLEIGSTQVGLSVREDGKDAWDDISGDIDRRMQETDTLTTVLHPTRSGGVRIVRTDGFRA